MKKNKTINYNQLRPDVLVDLVAYREIECNNTKADMIRKLKMDDEGKYIRETYVEKIGKDEFLIGIDIKNHPELVKISQFIFSGKVRNTNMYYNHRAHFISKLTIDELNL